MTLQFELPDDPIPESFPCFGCNVPVHGGIVQSHDCIRENKWAEIKRRREEERECATCGRGVHQAPSGRWGWIWVHSDTDSIDAVSYHGSEVRIHAASPGGDMPQNLKVLLGRME